MTAIATSNLDGAAFVRKGLDRKGLDHCERIAPFGRSGLFAIRLAAAGLVAAGFGLAPGSSAAGDTLQVTNARVPASDQVGVDLPLLMTIRNDGPEADAIWRVRCPIANFSDKHIVDRGEGGLAMRAVKSIPIPENKTVELTRDGYHVMLLQTRQKLVDGEKFTCAVVFQNAGTKETEVLVSPTP
jgi:periplasmic copper chaperone A